MRWMDCATFNPDYTRDCLIVDSDGKIELCKRYEKPTIEPVYWMYVEDLQLPLLIRKRLEIRKRKEKPFTPFTILMREKK